MKRNFSRCTFFLLLFFTLQTSFAQVFWSEHFDQSGLPAGWQTTDPSGNQKLWTRCETSAGCLPGNLIFQSESAADGFAFIRSSGNGPLANNHLSRLTSAPINCAGKNEVILEFQAYLITFNIHAAKGARVKVRSGTGDWKTYLPFCHHSEEPHREKISKNPERISLDISEVAAGKTAVQIEWEWEGNDEVFWCLDDVQLLSENPFYKETVWGREPGTGDFSGGLNGWTVNALSNPAKSWTWDSTGNVLKARSVGITQFPFPYIETYSSCNGTAAFNADFYSTGGTNPITPPYPVYEGELISPAIDLSNQTEEVALQFTQLVRLLNPHPSYEWQTSIAVSTDNGRTWSELKNVNEDVPQSEWHNSTRNIPLSGVEGNSRVKIKFVFAGDLYFWVLDDVMLVRRKRNDLALKTNFFAIAPNAMTPASQVEPFGFLCDFENSGTIAQPNTRLSNLVVNADNGEILFRDTLHFSEIIKDELIQNQIFAKAYEPERQVQNLEGVYTIGSDSLDQELSNNEILWRFSVTDSIFAKEMGFTKSVIPSRNPPAFHYGNCFFVPNGEHFAATAISFGISNSSALRGRELTVNLFEWVGDVNADLLANPSEYVLVGSETYKVKGNEGAVSQGIITVPIFDLSGAPVFLKNQKYYLATVEYQTALNLPCEMMFSDAFDYKAAWFVSSELGRPHYAGMDDFDLNGNFDIFGFGMESVPLIRLHISKNAVSTHQTEPASLPDFSIFPNPATHEVFVNGFFENLPFPAFWKITDQQGKVVFEKEISNLESGNSWRIDLKNFPKGFYLVSLKTAKGVLQKKLLVF